MLITKAIGDFCRSIPGGIYVPTDGTGHLNINVAFINPDGSEDETQFDVRPSHFDHVIGKCDELAKLWKGFCKENGFRQDSVTEIYFGHGGFAWHRCAD